MLKDITKNTNLRRGEVENIKDSQFSFKGKKYYIWNEKHYNRPEDTGIKIYYNKVLKILKGVRKKLNNASANLSGISSGLPEETRVSERGMGVKEIMAKKFPKLVKSIDRWMQAQQTADKENIRKHIKVSHNKSNYENQR